MAQNPSSSLLIQLTKLVDIACFDEYTTKIVETTLDRISKQLIGCNGGIPTNLEDIQSEFKNKLENTIENSSEMIDYNSIMFRRGQSDDKEKVRKILGGFDPSQSEAWKRIEELYGQKVKQPPLLEIINMICNHVGLHVSRHARRRKAVLIKWIHDNWKDIGQYLDYFVVDGDNVRQIKPLQSK